MINGSEGRKLRCSLQLSFAREGEETHAREEWRLTAGVRHMSLQIERPDSQEPKPCTIIDSFIFGRVPCLESYPVAGYNRIQACVTD